MLRIINTRTPLVFSSCDIKTDPIHVDFNSLKLTNYFFLYLLNRSDRIDECSSAVVLDPDDGDLGDAGSVADLLPEAVLPQEEID